MRWLILLIILSGCGMKEECRKANNKLIAAMAVRQFVCEDLSQEAPRIYAKPKCYYAKRIEKVMRDMVIISCE